MCKNSWVSHKSSSLDLGSLLALNALTGSVPSELCAVTTLTSFDAQNPNLVCPTATPSSIPSTSPSAGSSAPSTAPSVQPRNTCSDEVAVATDMVSLRNLFVQLGVSQADVYENTATPQYRALIWLTPGNINSAVECRLVQRYALATLLYASGNEARLSSSSECDWWLNKFVCTSDKLVTIQLGKDMISIIADTILKRSY